MGAVLVRLLAMRRVVRRPATGTPPPVVTFNAAHFLVIFQDL